LGGIHVQETRRSIHLRPSAAKHSSFHSIKYRINDELVVHLQYIDIYTNQIVKATGFTMREDICMEPRHMPPGQTKCIKYRINDELVVHLQYIDIYTNQIVKATGFTLREDMHGATPHATWPNQM